MLYFAFNIFAWWNRHDRYPCSFQALASTRPSADTYYAQVCFGREQRCLLLSVYASIATICLVIAPAMENHVSGQSNTPLSKPAHALERDVITEELNTNPLDGLTPAEAKSRFDQHGRNELDDGPGVQPFKILLRQVANAMMLVPMPT